MASPSWQGNMMMISSFVDAAAEASFALGKRLPASQEGMMNGFTAGLRGEDSKDVGVISDGVYAAGVLSRAPGVSLFEAHRAKGSSLTSVF